MNPEANGFFVKLVDTVMEGLDFLAGKSAPEGNYCPECGQKIEKGEQE